MGLQGCIRLALQCLAQQPDQCVTSRRDRHLILHLDSVATLSFHGKSISIHFALSVPKMLHSIAWKFLPWSFVFAFIAMFAQIVQATSQAATIKPQPLVAVRQLLTARDPTSYQLNPSDILWPPDGTTQDANSCMGSTAVGSCTVEYCSKKVALTCWTHAY
jgi:hypothetical protein